MDERRSDGLRSEERRSNESQRGSWASKHQHTRRALAAAAIAEAERIGVAHVTVADIARQAGVSRRTFFRHFATKDDVFLSCVGAGSGTRFDAGGLRGGLSWAAIRRACVEQTRVTFLDPNLVRLVHAWVDADASLHAAYLAGRDRQVRELILALTVDGAQRDSFEECRTLLARCGFAAVETAFERWLHTAGADAPTLVRMINAELDRLEPAFGSAREEPQ